MLAGLIARLLPPLHARSLVAGRVGMAKKRAAGAARDGGAAAPAKRGRRAAANAKGSGSDNPAVATDGTAAAAAAAAEHPAGGRHEAGAARYFLVKSEPDVFSIDDLAARADQTEPWDGVRNHQAKKVLQSMRVGDRAFFYHSNAKPPGIVGIVEIVKEAYPDHTQWDPKSKYHDASTSEEKPKWFMVDCKLVRKLDRLIPLDELKSHKEGALAGMHLFKYGRLSVQSVAPAEWDFVLGLERQPGEQLPEGK